MPADAMPSPAAEQDYAHSSCPPEESQMRPEYESHHESNGETSMEVPIQQPTPPPSDRDVAARAQSPPESHVKPSDTPIATPARDIPTPISATEDIAEDHRNGQTSPLSLAAPMPMSWSQHRFLRSPYPSHRVCITNATYFWREARDNATNTV